MGRYQECVGRACPLGGRGQKVNVDVGEPGFVEEFDPDLI